MTMLRNAVSMACALLISAAISGTGHAGATIANGWYEGEEIHYIVGGLEEGIVERGANQMYLIGGADRLYQANVVLHVPGEFGYTPHWNVKMVHTAFGKTLADILASPYASELYPEALFDDAMDIMYAEAAGLVTVDTPGVVVFNTVIPEQAAAAGGNTELPEDFAPFPDTF